MKVNPLKSFFESKTMQNFYKKACDPKNASFFNNTLPTFETALSTIFYCVATAKQRDIPKEQKNVLQWQNVLSGVAGMAIGSVANRKVSKFADELVPLINKEHIEDVHKVVAGTKVVLPLIATALLMRLVMPVIVAQASTMIEDHRRAKKKAQGLNVKA